MAPGAALAWVILLRAAWTAGGLRPPTDLVRGFEDGCLSNSSKISAWTKSGSSSRLQPHRSTWMDRLKRSVQDGARQGCRSDVVATSFGRSIGLGSRINTLVNELLVAVHGGFSFSICNGTRACNDGLTRIWSPHFENTAAFSFCESDRSPCGTGLTGRLLDTAKVGKKLSRDLATEDRQYLEDLKRFLYSFIWTVNSNLLNRVDMELREAGLDMAQPYVGVHVRRGDKIAESKPVEIGVYAKAAAPLLVATDDSRRVRLGASLTDAVRRELETRNAKQVFLCTDDESAAEELRMALGSGARIITPLPSDSKTRDYESKESILGVIVAVEGLRRAHAFVGTASSNIGRLVYFLRPKGSKSISMDLGGNFLRPGW